MFSNIPKSLYLRRCNFFWECPPIIPTTSNLYTISILKCPRRGKNDFLNQKFHYIWECVTFFKAPPPPSMSEVLSYHLPQSNVFTISKRSRCSKNALFKSENTLYLRRCTFFLGRPLPFLRGSMESLPPIILCI